ncbi:UNVERIFIED_CONTAM: hypothetical protein PYX00_010306 [Menopon gallinae]|uniref:FZ domain-containing protein n=1 Tax=Menopon gallinae TaxID=328185 RepID=A0AAW2HEM5_9NEOP
MDSAESGCKWSYRNAKKSFPFSNCLIIALPIVCFLALGIYFILVDLKILASVLDSSSNGTVRENDSQLVLLLEKELLPTTQEPFLYSPTVPHLPRDREETAAKIQESSEGANCFSTRLAFCEGVLPYDLVQLPEVINATHLEDLEALLPRFERLADANCSARAREFACALLEPECGRQVLPCGSNCRAVAEECGDVISGDPVLAEVFDCRSYSEWEARVDCVDLFTEHCYEGEFRCPSGRCIPLSWTCNGRDDCHDNGSDESNCPTCPEGFFRCVADGSCLPMELVCDGAANCSDNSDESLC